MAVPLIEQDIGPAVSLREYLQKARAEGQEFELAFQLGIVRAVRGMPNGHERQMWIDLLNDLHGVWKKAWHGEDPCPYLGTLMAALDSVEFTDD